MKAVILAGGKGTRLFPLTVVTPKPLIMIRGRPMIQYVIERLCRVGVSKIIICVSDRYAEHFRNSLGNGDRFGASLEYSEASEDIATSGRLLRCAPMLKAEDFLVYYADIFTNLSIEDLMAHHRSGGPSTLCTIAVTENKLLEFGVVKSAEGRVNQFLEKPPISQISAFKANIGIAVCRPEILNYCGDNLDLFGDVIPRLLQRGIGVACKSFEDPYVDIGTFAALEKASDLVKLEA